MHNVERYCNSSCGCSIGADCPRHILNSIKPDREKPYPRIEFVHLEDNPNYCKKPNWYGYQVKED